MKPKVLISSPRGKDKLVAAFIDAGAEVVDNLSDNPVLIIPTVDEEMPFFSSNKGWFLSQGINVMVNDTYVVGHCQDKLEFYRFCERHKFGTPRTMYGDLIAKPRYGKGGKGLLYINQRNIVQERAIGTEYSIDYFKYGDTLSVIPRQRLNVVDGESQEALIIYDNNLIYEATRLGEALKLVGHNVMQCIYDGKTVKWLEINLRYGGGSWLTFNDFNSPKFLVDKLCLTR